MQIDINELIELVKSVKPMFLNHTEAEHVTVKGRADFVTQVDIRVQEYMRKLFMPEHFADMKQAYIAGLLKALKTTILSKACRLPRSRNGMWNGRYWTMCALCVQASQHKASQNMPSSVKQWRYGTNTSLIIQMKH